MFSVQPTSGFGLAMLQEKPKHALLSRTKWAIYEQGKFERLINDLKNLVDGLHQIVHVDRETQDNIIVADIESVLDLSHLRLVEAASEDSHRTWSNVAKSVIAASEAGTTDRRHAEEILRDVEGLTHSNKTARSQTDLSSSVADLGTRLYEIFTYCYICLRFRFPSRQVGTLYSARGAHWTVSEVAISRPLRPGPVRDLMHCRELLQGSLSQCRFNVRR